MTHSDILSRWSEAAETSVGFFWMALWAFVLGYALSSMIQIFVTSQRMQRSMGDTSFRSVALGTFFGFLSSSCSFSALATAKSLFQKGASFVSVIAFLLSSTNLVIELGIVISIFLGWQFVVGEYLGGLLLIAISWALIRLLRPRKLIDQARQHLGEPDMAPANDSSFLQRVTSSDEWIKVSKQYVMEWKMVWKDVTVGFTVAGIIAAFVPDSFFHSLFVGSGEEGAHFGFWTLLQHVVIGPVAAFLTFIGSMGNIPLAALLFGKGVSFAGVMAFIFSDLVVFPVLRINASYYGWKMSLFILLLLFTSLILTSLGLHYLMDWSGQLPQVGSAHITEQSFFKVNHTFFLNLVFILVSGVFAYLTIVKGAQISHHKEMAPKGKWTERIMTVLAYACYVWIGIGCILWWFA